MTETEAIRRLAREQKISEAEARRRLEAAAEQLDDCGDDYTLEECYQLARDFFADA